jgi:hypothetical protein
LSTSPDTVGARPGLSNIVDIIVSPNAAFDRLRAVPTWGWAFLVATLLGIIGALIVGPAVAHALDASLPAQLAANDQIAKLSPADQQKQIAAIMSMTKTITRLSWLIVPVIILVAGLVQALLMLIANAAGHGDGSFKKFFALSITVAVVGEGLRSIVLAIIVLLQGANSFDNATSLQYSVVPGLSTLVPGAHGPLQGFLGAFNVFYLWAAALLGFGMIRMARIPRVTAWATALVILLVTAAFFAFGAKNS